MADAVPEISSDQVDILTALASGQSLAPPPTASRRRSSSSASTMSGASIGSASTGNSHRPYPGATVKLTVESVTEFLTSQGWTKNGVDCNDDDAQAIINAVHDKIPSVDWAGRGKIKDLYMQLGGERTRPPAAKREPVTQEPRVI